MNHAHIKRLDNLRCQPKPIDQMTPTTQKTRLTPAGRAFRKQWGRGSEQTAHKVSKKYPYLTAPVGILYFLMSK